jgi:hypothetical protein
MSVSPGPDEDLIRRLPLPMAQLYRRACNAKTALDRHHNAYYLAEATLKLAAALRIGAALVTRREVLPRNCDTKFCRSLSICHLRCVTRSAWMFSREISVDGFRDN